MNGRIPRDPMITERCPDCRRTFRVKTNEQELPTSCPHCGAVVNALETVKGEKP